MSTAPIREPERASLAKASLQELAARAPRFRSRDDLEAHWERLLGSSEGRVRRTLLGRSRQEHPIPMYSFGRQGAARNLLIVGVPGHPEEILGTSSGAATGDFLESPEGRALLSRHDLAVHIIPVADPDGLKRGEKMLALDPEEMELEDYFLAAIRTLDQAEWTLPYDWERPDGESVHVEASTPEAEALDRAIELIADPYLVIQSLHDAVENDGVYWNTTRPEPLLEEALRDLAHALDEPVADTGPEQVSMRRWSPGVFEKPSEGQRVRYERENGRDPGPPRGGGVADLLASRFPSGSAYAATGEPHRFSGDLNLRSEIFKPGQTLREVLLGAVADLDQLLAWLGAEDPQVRELLQEQDLLHGSSHHGWMTEITSTRDNFRAISDQPEYARAASTAEIKHYRVRWFLYMVRNSNSLFQELQRLSKAHPELGLPKYELDEFRFFIRKLRSYYLDVRPEAWAKGVALQMGTTFVLLRNAMGIPLPDGLLGANPS